ncbi:hypothetical protein ACPOL_0359 [Acidisarcina polymorpha]|uniref:Uncharacterized protein n=1 Tax=Acidisarcina polymorpha TaxID=2211140 RepID=A0A2Z5FSE6_9BACT|nr:hypothetical protein ACPOL_0359 [Acidisarcina polymorpha]
MCGVAFTRRRLRLNGWPEAQRTGRRLCERDAAKDADVVGDLATERSARSAHGRRDRRVKGQCMSRLESERGERGSGDEGTAGDRATRRDLIFHSADFFIRQTMAQEDCSQRTRQCGGCWAFPSQRPSRAQEQPRSCPHVHAPTGTKNNRFRARVNGIQVPSVARSMMTERKGDLPIWCKTPSSRRRAASIVFLLWITSVSMLISAYVCSIPWPLKLVEAMCAAYFIVHLVPMTGTLFRSLLGEWKETDGESRRPQSDQRVQNHTSR